MSSKVYLFRETLEKDSVFGGRNNSVASSVGFMQGEGNLLCVTNVCCYLIGLHCNFFHMLCSL